MKKAWIFIGLTILYFSSSTIYFFGEFNKCFMYGCNDIIHFIPHFIFRVLFCLYVLISLVMLRSYIKEKKQDVKLINIVILLVFFASLIFLSYNYFYTTTLLKCSSYHGDRKEVCIIHYAEFMFDVNICENIINQSRKDNCYFYFIGNSDKNICFKIVDEISRGICLTELSKSTNDESWCNQVSKPDLFADCFQILAIQKNNSLICNNILDLDRKGLCFGVVASNNFDLDICKNISEVKVKQACYDESAVSLARKVKDISFCQLITDISQKEYCYDQVAIYSKNSDFCSMIKNDSSLKSHCLGLSK